MAGTTDPEAWYASSTAVPYPHKKGFDAGRLDEITETWTWQEQRQNEDEAEVASCDSLISPESIHIDIETSEATPSEYSQPSKEYGPRWEWNLNDQNYVRIGQDGGKQFYSEYQKLGSGSVSPETAGRNDDFDNSAPPRSSPDPRTAPTPRASRPLSYEQPLGDAFKVVAKPKRFFCVGRIFKTVWFEPGSNDTPTAPAPGVKSWADNCLPFHGEKPVARFRYFIVARRRLHYSLCFTITTFKGNAPGRKGAGRPADYVVLHRSNVPPPAPYPEEEITKDPIAVIIEDEGQSIAPIARLDCGRIYTVPDSLKVLKIGRLHPASLPLLDEYFGECVK